METIEKKKSDQPFWHFVFSAFFVFLVVLALSYLQSKGELPHKISPFDFVLLSLATFRLIRLFVYDVVTDFIREYFANHHRGPKKTIFHLLNCPWCTGVWMAFFVSFFYFATLFAWFPILFLAIAGLATFIQITIYKIGFGL